MAADLLKVENLRVEVTTEERRFLAVRDVSFTIKEAGTLGIVGESGSGKSIAALSLVDLTQKPAVQRVGGKIYLQGKDVSDNLQSMRGRDVALIFQEPMTALNPVRTLQSQFEEIFQLKDSSVKSSGVSQRIAELMEGVGIPNGSEKVKEYPHRLSGGLRQRMMIAMALACEPKLLIADEPTTALDVTIQAQILLLLAKIRKEKNLSLLLISHDLAVVAEVCERIIVMYAGETVEEASSSHIFSSSAHPYTQALLGALPRLESKPKSRLTAIKGQVPQLWKLPQGCTFTARCPHAREICSKEVPPYQNVGDAHYSRCHFASKLQLRKGATS